MSKQLVIKETNKSRNRRRNRKPQKKVVITEKVNRLGRYANRKKQQERFKKPLGFGYLKTFSAPMGKGFVQKNTKQAKFQTKGNVVRVTHREFLGNLPGSSDISLYRFRINPADPVTFPWLSTLANAYEKFKLLDFKVVYKANCASITEGLVFMYPDYDSNNAPMLTENTIFNSMDTVTSSAWISCNLGIKANKFNQTKNYLIRSPYESYTDYLLYDPLNVFFGTVGTGDPNPLGQIWVEYSIELQIPDPQKLINPRNMMARYSGNISNVNSGLYVPDIAGAVVDQGYAAGNFWIIPTGRGWQMPEDMTGLISIILTASNFDALRDFQMATTNTTDGFIGGVRTGFALDDSLGGTDIWTWIAPFKAKAGDEIYFSNSLTTGNVAMSIQIYIYSCNPNTFNSLATDVTPMLSGGERLTGLDLAVVKRTNGKGPIYHNPSIQLARNMHNRALKPQTNQRFSNFLHMYRQFLEEEENLLDDDSNIDTKSDVDDKIN